MLYSSICSCGENFFTVNREIVKRNGVDLAVRQNYLWHGQSSAAALGLTFAGTPCMLVRPWRVVYKPSRAHDTKLVDEV